MRFDIREPDNSVEVRLLGSTGAETVELVIDGVAVATPEDVARIIRRQDPGDVISIEFERRGNAQEVEVSLGTRADASNGD